MFAVVMNGRRGCYQKMLEVTILKLEHKEGERTSVLHPYIEKCHVFGVEDAGTAEELTEHIENKYIGLIKSGASLRELRQKICPADADRKKFAFRVLEDLFQDKKPIWFYERFPLAEARKMQANAKEIENTHSHAINRLALGDIDGFFTQYQRYLTQLLSFDDERDIHIGQDSLPRAEEGIRRRYPDLANIDPINYTLFIGSAHKPENFVHPSPNLKVDVWVKIHQNKPLYLKVEDNYRGGISLADMQREVLAVGVCSLVARKLLTLSEHQIEQMSFEELSKEVQNVGKR